MHTAFMAFVNRVDAGRRLAELLRDHRGGDVAVLGLPRGGVPVAEQVALALHAPLDVILVRKLGVPLRPELAAGALGEGGVRVVNPEVVGAYHLTDRDLDALADRQRYEIERRAQSIRRSHPRLSLIGRTAIVVDDGIATGATARAACHVARAHGAARVVLAVPVAPPGWVDELGDAADEYVCVETPPRFSAVGEAYADFTATSDDDVLRCLNRSSDRGWNFSSPAEGVRLEGHITLPGGSSSLVIFVHGSGSSRHSPRNHALGPQPVRGCSGEHRLLRSINWRGCSTRRGGPTRERYRRGGVARRAPRPRPSSSRLRSFAHPAHRGQ